MFDEMLAIKRFREQQAELALLRQRQRRAEAEMEAEKARDRLEKYRDWLQEYEQSLYRDLCERVVRPREIEEVLVKVADVRKNEDYYASALEKASETLEQETQVLGECRQAHAQTVRLIEKFTEVAQVYWDDVIQLQNRVEDGELEEMASLSWDRSEWHESEDGFL